MTALPIGRPAAHDDQHPDARGPGRCRARRRPRRRRPGGRSAPGCRGRPGGDGHRQQQGGRVATATSAEDAGVVEPEVVADVGQQHGEGAAVELVGDVEPEQDGQRGERAAAGDARRRAPGAAPPPAGVVGRHLRRSRVTSAAPTGSSTLLGTSSAARTTSATSSGSSVRTSATRLGTTSPRRAATRRRRASRPRNSSWPSPPGSIVSTRSTPTADGSSCQSERRNQRPPLRKRAPITAPGQRPEPAHDRGGEDVEADSAGSNGCSL